MENTAVKKAVKKRVKKTPPKKAKPSSTKKAGGVKPSKVAPITQARPTFAVSFIAHALNIDERRVQQLAKEGIIPKSARGKYDLIGCTRGYCKYLQENSTSTSGRPGSEFSEQRARLYKLKADQLEHQIAVEKKKYIPVDDVKTLMVRLITSAKSKLLSIPKRLAPILLPMKTEADIYQEINSHIKEVLEELAEQEKK